MPALVRLLPFPRARWAGPAVLAAALFAGAEPASAHILSSAGGFASGFAHPMTGADHFLAMFAVGIWGAQMGGRSVWTLPVTFPLIMAAAGLAGMSGLVLTHVETGIALSILALGLAIALRLRVPEALALLAISVFAVFHGYAHGVELPLATDPAAYAVGFVVATGCIHVLGIGVGLVLLRPMRGRLAQGLGAAIAAAGVAYLVA